MTVMSGATIVAAENPAMPSDANRSPKFFVFHTAGSFISVVGAGGVRVVIAFEDASILTLGVVGTPTPRIRGVILDSWMIYMFNDS